MKILPLKVLLLLSIMFLVVVSCESANLTEPKTDETEAKNLINNIPAKSISNPSSIFEDGYYTFYHLREDWVNLDKNYNKVNPHNIAYTLDKVVAGKLERKFFKFDKIKMSFEEVDFIDFETYIWYDVKSVLNKDGSFTKIDNLDFKYSYENDNLIVKDKYKDVKVIPFYRDISGKRLGKVFNPYHKVRGGENKNLTASTRARDFGRFEDNSYINFFWDLISLDNKNNVIGAGSKVYEFKYESDIKKDIYEFANVKKSGDSYIAHRGESYRFGGDIENYFAKKYTKNSKLAYYTIYKDKDYAEYQVHKFDKEKKTAVLIKFDRDTEVLGTINYEFVSFGDLKVLKFNVPEKYNPNNEKVVAFLTGLKNEKGEDVVIEGTYQKAGEHKIYEPDTYYYNKEAFETITKNYPYQKRLINSSWYRIAVD